MHHQRRARRQRAVADRLREALSTTPNPGFTDPSEHQDLHDAVAALDPIDRDIIGLVHWEGFSLAEASSILGKKEGTVRGRYHRARTALRSQLEADTTASVVDPARPARQTSTAPF
ncbi:sigma factor-like helix-turn-helix DNA-binding protein [Microbacterium chocolatum]|uniref:RNA polymerase sigma factor n=1 Tax=Microbacterium aurantiacum TaxID=162393 RepID=UPI00338EB91A